MEDHSQLIAFLAHFHQLEQLPRVILVDGTVLLAFLVSWSSPGPDFSEFFSSLSDKTDHAAHALALLKDAAEFTSAKL